MPLTRFGSHRGLHRRPNGSARVAPPLPMWHAPHTFRAPWGTPPKAPLAARAHIYKGLRAHNILLHGMRRGVGTRLAGMVRNRIQNER
eukprot:8598833-Pyramimonas_sp.AAC.1